MREEERGRRSEGGGERETERKRKRKRGSRENQCGEMRVELCMKTSIATYCCDKQSCGKQSCGKQSCDKVVVNKVVINKVVINKVVVNKVVVNKVVVASNNHMISPHSTCVSLCTLASRILSDMSSLCILLRSSANLCKENRAEIT